MGHLAVVSNAKKKCLTRFKCAKSGLKISTTRRYLAFKKGACSPSVGSHSTHNNKYLVCLRKGLSLFLSHTVLYRHSDGGSDTDALQKIQKKKQKRRREHCTKERRARVLRLISYAGRRAGYQGPG